MNMSVPATTTAVESSVEIIAYKMSYKRASN